MTHESRHITPEWRRKLQEMRTEWSGLSIEALEVAADRFRQRADTQPTLEQRGRELDKVGIITSILSERTSAQNVPALMYDAFADYYAGLEVGRTDGNHVVECLKERRASPVSDKINEIYSAARSAKVPTEWQRGYMDGMNEAMAPVVEALEQRQK